MIGLSGIIVAIAVFLWAGVVAFWSRRWSVWAVTIFSVSAFYIWKAALESDQVNLVIWVGAGLCLAGVTTIILLVRRARV